MLRLGVDDEGNPHRQALEQERHDDDFGGFRGFHGVVRARDNGGNGEHAVVAKGNSFVRRTFMLLNNFIESSSCNAQRVEP
jgi:hypothetical protein